AWEAPGHRRPGFRAVPRPDVPRPGHPFPAHRDLLAGVLPRGEARSHGAARTGAARSRPGSDGYGARAGNVLIPNRLRSTLRAASNPPMPCTEGPLGVDAEHRNTSGFGVLYGSQRRVG